MSEHDICLLILFLGLFVESVNDVEHGVAGHHVVAGLGAALCVDRAVHVREVAQEVETVDEAGEAAAEEGAAQAGVPDEVVGVHRRRFVTATAVHRQVGGELQLPGQLQQGRQSVVEVGHVHVGEILAVARNVRPGDVALQTDVVLSDFVFEAELVNQVHGVDHAPLHGRGTRQVHVVQVAVLQGIT